MSQPVLQFDVEYPEHLSRLLIFVKWLLVIPHFILLYVFMAVFSVTTFLAWFAILFTGRYPEGLFNLGMMFVRYNARVSAYLLLLRDEYPPFGDGDYPVLCRLDRPERLSRWKIFVKFILLIPHLIVLSVLGILQYAVTVIAWFAILITGRYPRGLFNFTVGTLRWAERVTVYAYLLTDAYPPFSMAPLAPVSPAPAIGTV